MESIGLHEMPSEAIESIRSCKSVLRGVLRLSRGKSGRVYVRIEQAAIERKDIDRLVACPLFARIMAPAPLTLVFDPDLASPIERERRRAAMTDELREIAPEIGLSATADDSDAGG